MQFLFLIFLLSNSSQNFTIFYDKIDRKIANEILGYAEQGLQHAIEIIGYTPKNLIQIRLVSTAKEFRELTYNGVPDWSVGCALPSQNFIIIRAPRSVKMDVDLKTVTFHEITHIVLGESTNGRKIPRWFDEGMAMYSSSQWRIENEKVLSWAVFTHSLIPLLDIEISFPSDEDSARLAYVEGFSAVSFLIKEFGLDGLQELIRSMREYDFKKAMFISLSVPYNEFVKMWSDYAKKSHSGIYLLLYRLFPWGIILLIFFLVVIITYRKRFKRIRESPDSIYR